ncbi:Beclin-1-like protein [Nymphaea thermarum]|nr:Beclin-1-like protein [Nymphaea thermarum]
MTKEEQSVGGADKKGGIPLDPSLPRWACQSCRHPLYIVGVESYPDRLLTDSSRFGLHAASTQGAGSMLASMRMDHSFVILPNQKNQAVGIPPRPRSGTTLSKNAVSGPANPTSPCAAPKAGSSPDTPSSAVESETGKAMDESYVVLPPAAASMYKGESTSEAGGHLSPSSGSIPMSPLDTSNAGFHSSITVLKRAFEIATTQTQLDQPLCLECMRVLSGKLDEEVEDVNRDIKAYEACLQQLEGQSFDVLSESEFQKEKMKVEEEEKHLEAAIKEIEREYAEVNLELMDLESKSKHFRELEEKYWHDFNDFQFHLITHQEERDAILAKIEVSQAHLELLKRTNVLNDAFHIWHDGEFGTINNFRLGRLPKMPVEWDEINAAWGQACLLLHTMAQYFRPKYRIKILPMGSYPRIMDSSNNRYELFGPVNLFWSTRYDKAMTLFLACLKDFADFANAKDQENNVPPDKCFTLPYKIENDKVENLTITQSFNKQENWTKALKYMLCDLKWALYWFIGNTAFQPLSAMVPSHADMPTMNPKQSKIGGDPKTQSRTMYTR